MGRKLLNRLNEAAILPYSMTHPSPPVDREILTLTREGEWLADGQPIQHEPTRNLFSRSLRRRENGSWWLEIGRETKQVDVEDTALFVRLLEGSPESGLEIVLNDGTREPLRPETLLLVTERLTCLTARGVEAKFLRAPYADLMMRALGERDGIYQLRIGGNDYRIGTPLPTRILFFDGICGLCNRTVDFLLSRDRRERICFAPLQGRVASALLPAQVRLNLDTVIFWKKGEILNRSSAVLKSLVEIGLPWSLTRLLLLIPRFIRDFLYDLVASNRYAWFGRREICRMPTAEERQRILP
jgi:predicted DCC family thiol-disulfide oxidoreductase YuxK